MFLRCYFLLLMMQKLLSLCYLLQLVVECSYFDCYLLKDEENTIVMINQVFFDQLALINTYVIKIDDQLY